MTTIRIVAAVLDTQQLTLYHEDGQTTVLPQGDPRIRPILDVATLILSRPGQVATISLEHTNAYAAFEKKTNGLVKLFRVAKKAVSHLFGSDEEREQREIVEPTSVGQVPAANVEFRVVDTQTQKARNIDEIMAHATPVSNPNFKESETTEEHTMLAVVQTPSGNKLVPGVEALKDQMAHSAKLGSTQGVQALIQRLGTVIEKRGHSVEDVLRFLERGDLPLADDGDIVAYKILKRHPKLADTFVDCHTGKVQQRVGSYVCVDMSLVDLNRRNECSNGLHIARRGYLGNFSGDVCVLTKIAPEDVVTVPHNDPNKVRVCGYHIVGLIPDGDFQKLKRNQPMTEGQAQALLAQAISGKHIGKLEQVKITAQSGGGVVITPLIKGPEKVLAIPTSPKKLAEIPKAVALDDPTTQVGAVDPKAVNQQVKAIKAQPSTPHQAASQGTPRQDRATALVQAMRDGMKTLVERRQAAVDLKAHKKQTKVSWSALKVTTGDLGVMEQLLDAPLDFEQAKPATAPTPKPTPSSKPIPRSNAGRTALKEASKPLGRITLAPELKKKLDDKAAGLGPRQIKARDLAAMMRDKGKDQGYRKQAAQYLLDHKKAAKISWTALSLDEGVANEIKALLG